MLQQLQTVSSKAVRGPWAARDGWLEADSPVTDAWAPCHRQQTSSDLGGLLSTARADAVWLIRMVVQLHASMAGISVMLSYGHPHAIKRPSLFSAFVCI